MPHSCEKKAKGRKARKVHVLNLTPGSVYLVGGGGVFLLRVAYRTKWAVLAGAIDLMVLQSVSLSHYVAFGGSPFASTGYGYAIGSKNTEVDGSVDDGPELSVVS